MDLLGAEEEAQMDDGDGAMGNGYLYLCGPDEDCVIIRVQMEIGDNGDRQPLPKMRA